MKNPLILVGMFLALLYSISSCNSNKTTENNQQDVSNSAEMKMRAEQGLRAANDQFYAALNAMFTGNLEPMDAIWSHGDQVTDMGPFGGRLTGWQAVGDEFKKEAAMKLGGKVLCKELHVYLGTDMGYTVCVEEGENMSADSKPVVVSHRATNIFQLENGKWKMVHHQTDLSPQLEAATASEKK